MQLLGVLVILVVLVTTFRQCVDGSLFLQLPRMQSYVIMLLLRASICMWTPEQTLSLAFLYRLTRRLLIVPMLQSTMNIRRLGLLIMAVSVFL